MYLFYVLHFFILNRELHKSMWVYFHFTDSVSQPSELFQEGQLWTFRTGMVSSEWFKYIHFILCCGVSKMFRLIPIRLLGDESKGTQVT